MNDDDFAARLRAEEDQAEAGLLRLATRAGVYYRYLVLAGVPTDLIPELVSTYHAELVANSFAPSDDE